MINDVKKTTQTLAQQAAKQIAQEPIEILKQGGQQLTGNETQENIPQGQNIPASTENIPTTNPQEKAKLEAQGKRQIQALEAELKDIKVKNIQKEQAIERQEQIAKSQTAQDKKPLVEPPNKKGRQLAGSPGPKTSVQRQQTHVEKILPPSA